MANITPNKYNPFEVLDLVGALKTDPERITALRRHQTFELKTLLRGNFDPRLVFDLPEGAPPFRKDNSPAGVNHVAPRKLYSRLGYTLKNHPISRQKKEKIFLQILETVNARDSDLIVAMKDKNLQELYPFLTAELVHAAWPDLFEGWKPTPEQK